MRRCVVIIMMVLAVTLAPLDGMAKGRKAASAPPPTEDKKYASIVIDAATGAVISEKYEDRLLHPASLTKVMTLMLLFEQLDNGTMRLDDKIDVSSYAASQQPSKLGLKPGSTIRIEDAILAVVTKSANDMAVAIAEHVSGSEERFAIRMTRRAHEIGMDRTNFVNASGLHDPQQISTAHDMATLARYILVKYPAYYRYFGTRQFTYRGQTMTNHNRLMNTYPGMDGFKTGFVNASGFNLIASAKKGGRRLIGVVFGGRSWKQRNDHMAALLDAGFTARGIAPNTQAAEADQQPDAVPVVKIAAAEKRDMPLPEPKPQQKDDDRAPIPKPALKPLLKQTDGAGNVTNDDPGEMSQQDLGAQEPARTAVLTPPIQEKRPQTRSEKSTSQPLAPQHTLQLPSSYYDDNPSGMPDVQPAAAMPAPQQTGGWSVQIGAYNSRVATDDALRLAQTRLPSSLAHASPIVVPLKTSEGLLFRARLGGFSETQANQACNYFRDCLPVAPR